MKAQTVSQSLSVPEIKEYKNKYRLAAEEIYNALGINNYQNVFNCMTRFRANITTKSKVDIESIKKIDLVKGINWSGNQIQIIIGGEVIKVIDEFNLYVDEINKPKLAETATLKPVKQSAGSKVLAFLIGVMGPTIPLLMAAGMMSAIYALLTLPGSEVLMTKNAAGEGISLTNLNTFNLASGIFFILNKVILGGVGVFFIINTARYFKGNILFALAIGLTLVSRGFFPAGGGGVPYSEAVFGDWTSNLGKTGWLLVKLGDYPLVVGGYEGNIIPYMLGGILVIVLDKWIKTWIPSQVDIVFRPALVYLLSIMILWFGLAPIAGLIEYGVLVGTRWFSTIPGGIGVGIIAMLWQPLVLTGTHSALSQTIMLDFTSPDSVGYSFIYPAFAIGVFGQLGAAIGVAIKTKNITLRQVALGVVPGGVFGITEPILYGVNLPRVKPFLFGALAAFPAGVLSGVLKLSQDALGGIGVLRLLGFLGSRGGNDNNYNMPLEIGLVCLTWLVVISLAILLVLFFYKERKNELSYSQKAIKKLSKFINKPYKELTPVFETYTSQVKEMKNEYKDINQYYSDISRLEHKLTVIEEKESKKRGKMYKELLKLRNQLLVKETPEKLNKFNELNSQYSTFNMNKEKLETQTKLKNLINKNESKLQDFNDKKEDLYKDSIKIIDTYYTSALDTDINAIKDMIWNALNNIEISYEILDGKKILFTKQNKLHKLIKRKES